MTFAADLRGRKCDAKDIRFALLIVTLETASWICWIALFSNIKGNLLIIIRITFASNQKFCSMNFNLNLMGILFNGNRFTFVSADSQINWWEKKTCVKINWCGNNISKKTLSLRTFSHTLGLITICEAIFDG